LELRSLIRKPCSNNLPFNIVSITSHPPIGSATSSNVLMASVWCIPSVPSHFHPSDASSCCRHSAFVTQHSSRCCCSRRGVQPRRLANHCVNSGIVIHSHVALTLQEGIGGIARHHWYNQQPIKTHRGKRQRRTHWLLQALPRYEHAGEVGVNTL